MHLRAITAVVATFFIVVLSGACSGEGDLGEECGSEGGTEGECTNAGICGKDKAGKLVCLRRCVDQVQCLQGETCNGVTGSNIKGCR